MVGRLLGAMSISGKDWEPTWMTAVGTLMGRPLLSYLTELLCEIWLE